MILCPNGHENPDGTTYCRVCDAYIDTITKPPEPEEPPPPTLTADPRSVQLIAGSEATIRLAITNAGSAEDHYTLDLLGDDVAWCTVEPTIVSVAGGGTGTSSLVVRPPADVGSRRSATTIRATGSGGASAEVRIDVEITAVVEEPEPVALNARIDPLESRGTTHGDHTMTVENVGSSAATARLEGTAEAGALTFQFEPADLPVDAEASATSRLRVTPTKQIVIGRRRVHPFRVTVQPADGASVVVESRMIQRARIPVWLLVLLILAAALIILRQLASQPPPTVDRIPIDLSVADVGAPSINQIFDVDGVITPADIGSPLLLPGAAAAGFVQSRSWPQGEATTVGENLYAYLFRIDLTGAGPGDQEVRSFRIAAGPIEPLPYLGSQRFDVFVVTDGALGVVRPSAVKQRGVIVVFRFDPPVRLGESSFFFGFAAAGAPRTIEAAIVDGDGTRIAIPVTAPTFRRTDI